MISVDAPLLLGSASPRRRELLASLGIPLLTVVTDVDEHVRDRDTVAEYLERVVTDKLAAARLTETARRARAILVADTTVVIDGEILGKPATVAAAAAMVGRLAGRTHSVLTRYVIATDPELGSATAARTVESRVSFRTATTGELARYAETGEGLDKAGAYAVQGIGAYLVSRVEGSYTNVVGLPLCEVVVDLRDLGLVGDLP